MDIYKISGTCSMIELSSPTENDLSDRGYFLGRVNRVLNNNNEPDTDVKRYCIMYNCTNDRLLIAAMKLGFKSVFSYTGYDETKTVKVLMLEIDRIPWWRRIIKF